MKTQSILAVLFLLASINASRPAFADSDLKSAPWERTCSAYPSGRQLIQDSVLYCLSKSEQKECETRAANFFRTCRFSGDFHRTAARVRARMLLVLALGTVRSANHLNM